MKVPDSAKILETSYIDYKVLKCFVITIVKTVSLYMWKDQERLCSTVDVASEHNTL